MAATVVVQIADRTAAHMHGDAKNNSALPVLLGRDTDKESPVKVPFPSYVEDEGEDEGSNTPVKISLPSYGDEDDERAGTWPLTRYRKDRKSRQAVAEQKLEEWSYGNSDKMGFNMAAGVVFAPNLMGVPIPHALSAPPGLEPPPGAPSHGSVLHDFGTCKPCAWFWKKGGCQNGAECMHCHKCSEKEIKARRKNKVAVLRLLEGQVKLFGGMHGQLANTF